MPRTFRAKSAKSALTAAATAATALLALTACSTSPTSSPSGKGDAPQQVTVLAAASLTDVFGEAKKAYEKKHPDTRLTFSFAGSQELAAQVRQGVPADALVTADTRTMDDLAARTGKPTTIAKNRLTIATAPGNPKGIHGLADLSRSDLKVVLAAPQVPAGRYSKKVLDEQHVTVAPVSQEPSVRAVLSKVTLGEADAGLVYVTDATAKQNKQKVTTVTIPDAQNAVASYPAATLKNAKHPEQAKEFVAWLGTDEAQAILRKAGFQQP
ncbi:molybdenum ABC transporter ModA, periplasmic [Streptomyces mashuensis]|uniref:Molybdenum ABC transporter ModA, periplasmic n=1 Tax=Streptomyces mashuensis TaxID=33904 RepID=A0A919B8G5_9ACTN|nr:molybdate ABC transporter substrate-binding protein [Streptomyces mashuensis]GHF68514.1 molybdenum ABC transporter ModA, periplasmic [Streptomyces mashuensis]